MNFLLATDLLSRGLDIHQVESVINYSYPTEESRYIHRVGRTAWAGFTGTAVTLVNEDEKGMIKKVAKKCKSHALKFSVNQTI